MATITIRTDTHTDVILEKLEKAHLGRKTKRNTIIKAAIIAFEKMNINKREQYLSEVRSNDERRVNPRIW